jgi:hypothetical protein
VAGRGGRDGRLHGPLAPAPRLPHGRAGGEEEAFEVLVADIRRAAGGVYMRGHLEEPVAVASRA